MSDGLIAVTAALGTTLCAAGAGSFICGGAGSWSRRRRWVARTVLGLGLLPLILIILHQVTGLPVHPATALLVGIAGLALAFVQERRWGGNDGPEDTGFTLLLVVSAGLFFAALSGLLGQPGFDGLDPWRHCFGAAWVADSGLLSQPDPDFPLIHYVDAYPPLFDVLLSLPTASLGTPSAAVKGIAATMVAAAPLALWLLAGTVWSGRQRPVVAALVYAVLPNAVSRHLWGHSLAVVLILAGLAAALEMRRDLRWLPAIAIAFGGAVLAAPSQGAKGLALLAITAAIAAITEPVRGIRLGVAAAAAVAVASVWFLPVAARSGASAMALVRQMQPPELRRADDPISALDEGEEAPAPWIIKPQDRFGAFDVLCFRPYPLRARLAGPGMVNLTVTAGLGLPLLVMLAAGLAGMRRDPPCPEHRAAVAWLACAALLCFSAVLGVGLFPWRSWLLLAPFASLIAGGGIPHPSGKHRHWVTAGAISATVHAVTALTYDIGHGVAAMQLGSLAWITVLIAVLTSIVLAARRLPTTQRTAAAVLAAAHLAVAGPVRAATLLEEIPPRVYYDRVERSSYEELARSLPPGERVWPLSGGLRFDILNGLGLECTPFRTGELEMARASTRGKPLSAAAVVSHLRRAGYRWVVLDPSFDELQRALGDHAAFDRMRFELDRNPHFEARASTRSASGEPPRFLLLRVHD